MLNGLDIVALAAGDWAQLPSVADKPISPRRILDAMNAVSQGQTEAQMASLVRPITDDEMSAALQIAQSNLDAFDAAVQPTSSALEALRAALDHPGLVASAADIQTAQIAVAAARLRFGAVRYDQEANYNRVAGQLYEVEVRRGGVESDRHKTRSAGFFYGMLAAQAGVIVSSFALAVQRRSAFWALAAAAGAGAVAFSGYVYLYL